LSSIFLQKNIHPQADTVTMSQLVGVAIQEKENTKKLVFADL